VLAFAVFAMAFTSAYGASGIDLTKKGSITLNQQMDCTELSEQTYDVPLYLVAEVDVSGKYTLTPEFDFELLEGITTVKSTTDNETWKDYAAAAKAVVDGASTTDNPITPAQTVTVTKGSAPVADNLELGLYLAYVPTIKTPDYIYQADPLLIAVPGNNYYSSGDDEWIYSVENNLKFTREDRYGDLVISKTIDTLNKSLGNVSFVFQVTAVKDYRYTDVETDPKTVYNNVVSIDFSEAGTQAVTIHDIPAGANVTVTEVYSGANYTAEETTATATIYADNEPQAAVAFTNDYDDDTLTTGGNAVVNQFSYNGGWSWAEYIDGDYIDGVEVTPSGAE
jgi:hypothetical protein